MGEPNRRGLQVKEAITTLCRIFKYSGVYESVAPDDIRLAKFDKPEAISVLSKLLQSLLKLSDPINVSELSSKLQSLWYPRSNLVISSDGSFKSSRELLLAISWFLHVTKFIDRIRNKACQPLNVTKLWKKETKAHSSPIEPDGNLSMTERVSQLTWSVSQLSLWKKQLITTKVGTEVAKVKLAKDISAEFKDDPLLLLILKTPSFYTQYEKALEKKIYLLHACIQWKKLRSIFWVWMDSVLANAPDDENCPQIDSLKRCTVDGVKSELKTKINFLEQQICDQRLLYPKNTIDLSISGLSPEMKLSLSKEMETLRARLLDPCHCPSLRQADASPGSESSVRIEAEINRLVELNQQQTQKIKDFKDKTRKKLEAFSENFSGVVLVPPQRHEKGKRCGQVTVSDLRAEG